MSPVRRRNLGQVNRRVIHCNYHFVWSVFGSTVLWHCSAVSQCHGENVYTSNPFLTLQETQKKGRVCCALYAVSVWHGYFCTTDIAMLLANSWCPCFQAICWECDKCWNEYKYFVFIKKKVKLFLFVLKVFVYFFLRDFAK